jgi:hypothetical protein
VTDISLDTFETIGQWNKFCRLKKFFEGLIDMAEEGVVFLLQGSVETEPYIDGYEMGFRDGNCRTVCVGSSFSYNPKTDQYDIPWIDTTLKELKRDITPLKKVGWKSK